MVTYEEIVNHKSDGTLEDKDLSGADLRGAPLSGAKLANADLRGADASYSDWTDVRGPIPDLRKTTKVGITGLDLKKTGSITKGHSSVGKAGSRSIDFNDRRGEEDFGRRY